MTAIGDAGLERRALGRYRIVVIPRQPVAAAFLTRRFALGRGELITSGVAAVVSAGGYLTGGQPYLARGVVGDLIGFAALASVAARAHRRVRHEAAFCLTAIGGVLIVNPSWPLRISERLWWAVFALALVVYLGIRREMCD